MPINTTVEKTRIYPSFGRVFLQIYSGVVYSAEEKQGRESRDLTSAQICANRGIVDRAFEKLFSSSDAVVNYKLAFYLRIYVRPLTSCYFQWTVVEFSRNLSSIFLSLFLMYVMIIQLFSGLKKKPYLLIFLALEELTVHSLIRQS